MKTILLFAAVALLALPSCQNDTKQSAQNDNQQEPPVRHETPPKMIEQLVGEWEAAPGNNNEPNNASKTLTFTEEARYVVREGNEKTDSGAFRMNEQLRNLYLESESKEDAREYEVQLKQDTLILSAREKSQDGEEESIYLRRN